MDDNRILSEMRNGNEAAVKHLYTHLPSVKFWVTQNSGSEEDAFDLFQEALIVFCKNVRSGKYEPTAKISTYLFEICKRKWLKHVNKKEFKGKTSLDLTNVSQSSVFYVSDTPEKSNLESLQDYVSKCLDRLGDPCKTLLWKAIAIKTTMEQIAVELGYHDAHSARQQKYRCLKRLREFTSYEYILQLV